MAPYLMNHYLRKYLIKIDETTAQFGVGGRLWRYIK
jgi:hypothetical protein